MLDQYTTDGFYDEMLDDSGSIRPWYSLFMSYMERIGFDEVLQRQFAAERSLVSMGITFSVYGEGKGIERIFPFDVIPRIINMTEWTKIERGLQQRIRALNLFLDDIYNGQKILKDKIIPRHIIESSPGYLPQCRALKPPKKIWSHISGIDIIKHKDGNYYVLEDNVRVPSGVAYVLGNREIMKQTFSDVFAQLGVQPVIDYPLRLLEMLQYVSPRENSTVVVLTPGIYNSAYFEHSFLAQQMGVQLVEGRDLMVHDDCLYMRTTRGIERVDVIYRRIDDQFLDPAYFRSDSVLGVKGLLDVYQKGNVTIANAPGTGVCDDKVVYAYVPQIIKYYLDQDPILPNVPTYLCWDDKQRSHVIENIHDMVVKPANESGGYGILVGPHAFKTDQEKYKDLIRKKPRDYIAQPLMSLSRVPTIINDHLEGRHVDLRPYILYGEDIYVLPGGLTRVALKKGSCVVNSSQGGGSKDTWVIRSSRRKLN